MNIKLLKELYKQAETECGWSEVKFAELIIRESVAVADDYVKDCTCEEHINCKHRTSAIGRKIREHFGVAVTWEVICDRTNNP